MSYVFYCSRCRFDHAGECAPAAKYGTFPAVGSRWVAETDDGVDGKWRPMSGFVYEVIGIETSTLFIHLRGVTTGTEFSMAPKWFQPDGAVDIGGGRSRYVPAPNNP